MSVREWAETELAKRTPPGWTREFVAPPWKGDGKGCRSCGEQGAKTVGLLTRSDETRQVVRFTFGTVCASCHQDPAKMDLLADTVFGAALA